jgi:5-methylcytosine-specific restriction endonuclease McrA
MQMVKIETKKNNANRRAKAAGNNDRITLSELLQSYFRSGQKCSWCGKTDTQTMEVDHIIPLSKGGTNTIENMVWACRSCNSKKSASNPVSFAAKMRVQGYTSKLIIELLDVAGLEHIGTQMTLFDSSGSATQKKAA